MNDQPWLSISLADYEGHMVAVGQTDALRLLFSDVYGTVRPARLLVLGCTAGADFELIDPALTDVAVGVDLNPEYLAAGRERLAALGRSVELVCGDVSTVDLPQAPFDLVHAALLVEYVDVKGLLRRARAWLRPGGFLSVVSQEPSSGLPPVRSSGRPSLLALADHMTLRSADELARDAVREGFACRSKRMLPLPNGKVLAGMLLQKS